MSLLETNDRNLVICLIIVVSTGIMVPILSFGMNWGIMIQILQYLSMWGVLTFIPAVLFHFAPTRTEFQFKKFAIYTGLCFIPYLVQNIICPLLKPILTNNLDGVWDIDVIRQATDNLLFQAGVFVYVALPVIAFCLVIIFLGVSMNKVYDISIEKALLIAIPIVLGAYYISTFVGGFTLLLF